MRRCASTVKPPIDTKAMRSMPTVASASTIVAGLMMLALFEPGVVMKDEREERDLSVLGDTSKRALSCVGWVTSPGGTSANSSSRLWGFCTMPTTVLPPWDHVSPTCRLSSDAKPGVRAISFGPVG